MNSSCRIDADDRIVSVNHGWELFADSNGAPELFAEGVVGRSMWELIGDDAVKELFTALHETVRRQGRSIEFRYRCDAPEFRRFMQMRIDPLDGGHLQITHEITEEQPLPTPLYFTERRVQSPRQVLRCSVCNALNVGDGWKTVEEAIEAGLRSDEDRPIQVLYRVCDSCISRVRRLVGD